MPILTPLHVSRLLCVRRMDEAEEEPWSVEQLAALREAHASTPAGVSGYWRRVARGVPGKGAAQCASKFQETLAEGGAGAGAAKGERRGRRAEDAAASPPDNAARNALQAAALGRRGKGAREHALRAAGREVRWRQREAEAGYQDDAFEASALGAVPAASAAVQASLAAALAATGTERVVVPLASVAPQHRKQARAAEAYVEQTLRRTRPKVAAPQQQQPPAGKGGVRALIDSVATKRVPTTQQQPDEEEQEDSGEERDEYFSD